MLQILATAAVAFLMSASGASAYRQATVADTCTVVNFTERATEFTTLNTVVDLATANSGALLKTYLASYDPYIITNKSIASIPFTVLLSDFTLTPTLESMNLTGLTLVRPYHINTTGAHSVQVGAYFDGEVSIDATFSVEITQDHQWYEICWTNILDPWDCPPATITADVQLALQVPIINTSIDAYMYNCKSGISTSTCSNLTVSSILVAAVTGSYSTILTSIKSHMINASLSSFDTGFDSITNIEFTFHNTSSLINALINALLDFTADALNKKDAVYKTFMAVFNTVFKSILNDLLSDNSSTLFGSTCL